MKRREGDRKKERREGENQGGVEKTEYEYRYIYINTYMV
jgi:hypothetical protein